MKKEPSEWTYRIALDRGGYAWALEGDKGRIRMVAKPTAAEDGADKNKDDAPAGPALDTAEFDPGDLAGSLEGSADPLRLGTEGVIDLVGRAVRLQALGGFYAP